MPVPTIEWVGGVDGHVRLIDQTRLPTETCFVECRDVETMWEAIQSLRVRGAPAIGIAAVMGVVLGIQGSDARSADELADEVNRRADYLATSRPTAVNLFWGLDRMRHVAAQCDGLPVREAKERLLAEALAVLEEDKSVCRRIGAAGAPLIEDGAAVLTHCNAGGLATADYGTALAVIYAAHEQGKRVRVYADETRPLLQGARLTTWELMQAGIDVTLICDNTAGLLMKQGKVDLVLVGADRIAANGDVCNKIGTYALAVLARHHGVGFMVAAPTSTIDMSIASGADIPIEERAADEVLACGGIRVGPDGVDAHNPVFDVTPAALVDCIVTERGVVEQPDAEKMRALMEQ